MKSLNGNSYTFLAASHALALALASPLHAVDTLYGDQDIIADGGELGSLNVAGHLETAGDASVFGSFDFGVAAGNSSWAGGTLLYTAGTEKTAKFGLSDSSGSFLWRDNLGVAAREKMKLDGNNQLSLYNAAGTSATIVLNGGNGQINLSGTGSGLYANGTSVFTVGGTGNIVWDRALGITNTAASTSSTTGALTVAGGIGVGLDSYINGIRIGKGAGSQLTNTALGTDALAVNSTGHSNTAVGWEAMKSNTGGRQCVAVGYQALNQNIGGLNNTATGFWALTSNTTAFANTANGAVALRYTTTGGYNTASGNASLTANTTGFSNTGMGAFTLFDNITGSNNVAVGREAGRYQANGTSALTSPENSIYIGAYSRGFSDSDDNSIVIGHTAIGEGANTTVIGNSATVKTHLYGQTNANSLKVNGASDLNNQVVVEPAVAPATAVRAMRVLADGTILIKPGGDLSMEGFTGGEQP